LSPALARRKVFIVGEAERMVSQEGSEQAANAFLKLLEEPPADTAIILTSSEPGALLPTIRSRVVNVRVGPLADAEVKTFLSDERVAQRLSKEELPADIDQRIRLAAGAPGALLLGGEWSIARENAQRILDAAMERGAARFEVAWAQ